MGALDALIFGYRYLFADTTAMAQRSRLSFGPEFALEDDSENKWTRLTVSARSLAGNSAGLLTNSADVVQWSPSSTAGITGYTVAGTAATVDATPTPVALELGSPAVEIDGSDWTAQASAIVTARRPADGVAEVFRISRSFSRSDGDAVAALAATSNDGSAPASPTLAMPVIEWDSAAKFPKVTVTGDAGPDAIYWRAVATVLVMGDPG